MTIINLRDIYPFYTSDCLIEVPDEVAAAMAEFDRKEAAYRLRTYRYKAYYSLDRDDGIEHEAVFPMRSTSAKLPCRSSTLLSPACPTNRRSAFTLTSSLA